MAKHKKYSSHKSRNARDDRPSGMAGGQTTPYVHHADSPDVDRQTVIHGARSNGVKRAISTRNRSNAPYLSAVDNFMFPVDVNQIQARALARVSR